MANTFQTRYYSSFRTDILSLRSLGHSVRKMLRRFFRNNKNVLSDIARLICDMIHEYYKMLTGKEIRTGVVIAFQSFGDFLRFNPHFHCLILEGGFDENGNFIHIPITDLESMKECFRKLVIKYFEDSKLLSSELAKNLLSWKHSEFSIDNSISINSMQGSG